MGVLSSLRWSRSDQLIAHVVLIAAIAATGLAGVFGLVWITPLLSPEGAGPTNAITVPRPEGAPESVIDAATTAPGVTVTGTGRMVIEFHDPTTWERFLLVAPGLLGTATALVVLLMLYGLVRSLDRGDPFVPANVRRVYTIAFAVLVASLAVPALESLCDGVLRARALASDELVVHAFVIGGEGGISPGLVLAGFLLAALAEVFRRGADLRADVEGLV